MTFEYDPAKSAANKAKHGLDFEEAQALWDDPWLLETPAKTEDEPRFLSLGVIGGAHWTAVWTLRGENVRIISVRRARKEEPGKRRLPIMKATEFDKRFDVGDDVSAAVDWSKAKRPNNQARRVNVDFPAWVVEGLDRQARHLGVTRQSLIKMWIAERLE